MAKIFLLKPDFTDKKLSENTFVLLSVFGTDSGGAQLLSAA